MAETKDRQARVVAPARFVKLDVFEAITGYTVSACEAKIKKGVWLEGYEYVRAPDGSRLMDMEGYERWAAGQRRVG
ncbi:excisionase [Aquincola tertiaricarbonis]|uniref:Excisionase n=1 Tax=Aquincola tertiaricarbonis TaxID=391953 RepID=A0ABY4SDF6_AQUTE|nr:excisionase [Aquincola tertiaricarbonis]URI11029.1 excisionase [Aquincola tertiaricarbonis]